MPMSKPATTVKSPARTRKPRKSPLHQAIVAAEKAVLRAQNRKSRGFKSIARFEAKIASITANAGQFDALIAQLAANAETLRKMAAAIA